MSSQPGDQNLGWQHEGCPGGSTMYTWEKMELYMVRGSEEASMPGEDQANYFPA